MSDSGENEKERALELQVEEEKNTDKEYNTA